MARQRASKRGSAGASHSLRGLWRLTMTNPLLRPDDPRFRKPELRDAAGNNPFAEPLEAEAADASPAAGAPADEPFAAGATNDPRPFLERVEVQQPSRAGLLLVLAGLGWVAAVVGTFALTGLFASGWIGPLLGVIPAWAAWMLAYQDWRAVAAGAIDAAAAPRVRLAYWLGLTALLACGATVGLMIYQNMSFLPDLF